MSLNSRNLAYTTMKYACTLCLISVDRNPKSALLIYVELSYVEHF